MFCFLGRFITRNQNLAFQTSHLENEVAYFRKFSPKNVHQIYTRGGFSRLCKVKNENRKWETGKEQGERGTKLNLNTYPMSASMIIPSLFCVHYLSTSRSSC